MFDFEKLTKSAQNVIIEAQTLVKTNKNTFLEPAHIMLAMANLAKADSENSGLYELFSALKLSGNIFKDDLQNILNELPKVSNDTTQLYFSADSLKIMEDSKKLADKFNT